MIVKSFQHCGCGVVVFVVATELEEQLELPVVDDGVSPAAECKELLLEMPVLEDGADATPRRRCPFFVVFVGREEPLVGGSVDATPRRRCPFFVAPVGREEPLMTPPAVEDGKDAASRRFPFFAVALGRKELRVALPAAVGCADGGDDAVVSRCPLVAVAAVEHKELLVVLSSL